MSQRWYYKEDEITYKLLLEVKDLLGPLTVRGHVNK